MSANTKAGYIAWWRMSSYPRATPWEPVSHGRTEQEALNLGLGRTNGGSLVVLKEGKRPADGHLPNRMEASKG